MNSRYLSSISASFSLFSLTLLAIAVHAAEPVSAARSTSACTSIETNAARLACYDLEMGRATAEAKQQLPLSSATQRSVAVTPLAPKLDAVEQSSLLSKSAPLSVTWELEQENKRGTFRLLPYKLNYLLPVRYTSNTNNEPSSPALGRSSSVPTPTKPTEVKFQLSFKMKAAENIFGNNGDLWLAYTQQTNWQAYNKGISSPVRENDLEPEAILAFRTNKKIAGWDWKMVNLGLVHQSNGRQQPLSRSWNRAYAQFGLERGNVTVLARPWLRIPEKEGEDDMPDVKKYMGNGDLRVMYTRNGHMYSFLGRYSPSGRKGFGQVEWAFPIAGALKGYMQLTNGYGETLIDYNHSQTTIGAGFLLLPW